MNVRFLVYLILKAKWYIPTALSVSKIEFYINAFRAILSANKNYLLGQH